MKILYYKGIFTPEEIGDEYKHALDALARGEVTIKKLNGHKIYRIKVSRSVKGHVVGEKQATRLLLTIVEVEGAPHILVLEVVKNHKYDKARFLNPKVLAYFLEQHAASLKEAITKSSFQEVSAESVLPLSFNKPEVLTYSPVHFYNQLYILLSEEQESVLKRQLPVVVSGGAGSGKTCVAIAALEEALLSGTQGPLLYVTKSSSLVRKLKKDWEEQPRKFDDIQAKVLFMTYEDLLLKHAATECRDKAIVEEKDFRVWFSGYVEQQKSIMKATLKKSKSPSFLERFEAADIYETFRVISGHSNSNDYLDEGKKSSLFYCNGEERVWVIKAYTAYLTYLEKNNKINPNFFPMKHKSQYALIVVDEAQDCSRRELINLIHLAMNEQIVICYDSKQALYDVTYMHSFVIHYLTSVTHQRTPESLQISLPTSYRCPAKTIELANEIIALRNHCLKGIPGKGDYFEIKSNKENEKKEGTICWLEALPADQLAKINRLTKSPCIVVITQECFKEEAKKLFGTPLVFTPEEIKGLEYLYVILYRLWDSPRWKKIDAIKGPDFEVKKYVNRSKKEQIKTEHYDPTLIKEINQFFTAITRTLSHLILYLTTSPDSHHLRNLRTYFKKQNYAGNLNDLPLPASQDYLASSSWKEEEKKLRDYGHIEQAEAIVQAKLNLDESEFTEKHEEVREEAPDVKPVKQSKQFTKDPVTAGIMHWLIEPPDGTHQFLCHITDSKFLDIASRTPTKNKHSMLVEICLNQERLKSLISLHVAQNRGHYTLYQISCALSQQFQGGEEKYLFQALTYTEDGIELLLLLLKKDNDWTRRLSQKKLLLCSQEQTNMVFKSLSPFQGMVSKRLGHKLLLELDHRKKDLFIDFPIDVLLNPSKGVDNKPLFHYLTESREGIEFLQSLLKKNKELIKSLSLEQLTRSHPEATGSITSSALYNLASSSMALLGTLFVSNPQITEKWTADILCKSDQEAPLIYYFSLEERNLHHLQTILTKNPLIISELTPQALYLSDPSKSVPHNLCFSALGRAILEEIFQKNTALASKFSQEFVSSSNAGSMLHYLAKNNPKLLAFLLEKNQELLSKFPIEALCNPITEEQGTSPLLHLTLTEDGLDIVDRLIKSNHKAMDTIALYARFLYQGIRRNIKGLKNSSVLFWLSNTVKGQDILLKLFEKPNELVFTLTAEALTCVQHSAEEKKTVLYNLAATSTGRSILFILLKNNTKLARSLTHNDWLRPLWNNNKLESPINYLLNSCSEQQDSKDLLTILTQNSPILQKRINGVKEAIFPSSLKQDVAVMTAFKELIQNNLNWRKNQKNTLDTNSFELKIISYLENDSSLLSLLVSDEERQGLLANLLLNHQEWGLQFFSKDTYPWLIRRSRSENTSVFYELTKTALGQKFLEMFFEIYPDMPKKMTSEFAYYSKVKKLSSLYYLAINWFGHLLIERLTSINPLMWLKITNFTLAMKESPTAGSTFYYLVQTSIGCRLLEYWFTNNLSLVHDLCPEVLYSTVTEVGKKGPLDIQPRTIECSAFQHLLKSTWGRKLLGFLFENNNSLPKAAPFKGLCALSEEGSVFYTLVSSQDTEKIFSHLAQNHYYKLQLRHFNLALRGLADRSVSILKDLLKNNRYILQGATPPDLDSFVKVLIPFNKPESPIFHLASSVEGCELLNYFLSLNLELLSCFQQVFMSYLKTWLTLNEPPSFLQKLFQIEEGKTFIRKIFLEKTVPGHLQQNLTDQRSDLLKNDQFLKLYKYMASICCEAQEKKDHSLSLVQ